MAFIYLFKQCWKYAEKDRWKIIVFYIAFLIRDICFVCLPLIFAQILNAIQTSSPEEVLKTVGRWMTVWLVGIVAISFFPRLSKYLKEDVSYRIKQRFMNTYYGVVTSLPLGWHADHHSGDTINRINTAATSLYNFSQNQHIYIGVFIRLVGPVFALYFLDVGLTVFLMIAALVFVTFFVSRYFDKKLVSEYKKVNEINHKISAAFFDFVSNIRTIITLKLAEKTQKDLDEKLEQGYKASLYANGVLDTIKWGVLMVVVELPVVGIVYFYIVQQLKTTGTVLAGNVAAVLQYLHRATDSFLYFVTEAQKMMKYQADLEAVAPIAEAVPHAAKEHYIKKNWKEIQIKGLNFSYGRKTVLKNAFFAFKKGEKIAVVGESGSGKSTLMALIRGLYDADAGEVSVDGKKDVELGALSTITTLMPQDPEIFENTIEYNITMGLEYPKSTVNKVVELACFDKVLKKLPNGLQTDIREKGVNLSGGERQRLAFARNLLAAKESDIVLMDEPTSSVDMTNEKRIYQNTFEFCRHKTIISSVHKLYLLPLFDRVFYVENGEIHEREKD